MLRLKTVEKNSVSLSKQFVRSNLIYKEEIFEKTRRITVQLLRRPDSLHALNGVALGYFKSDGGQKAFVNNLSNAQLSPAVMTSFMKACKKSCYENLDSQENIGKVRAELNSQPS